MQKMGPNGCPGNPEKGHTHQFYAINIEILDQRTWETFSDWFLDCSILGVWDPAFDSVLVCDFVGFQYLLTGGNHAVIKQ